MGFVIIFENVATMICERNQKHFATTLRRFNIGRCKYDIQYNIQPAGGKKCEDSLLDVAIVISNQNQRHAVCMLNTVQKITAG